MVATPRSTVWEPQPTLEPAVGPAPADLGPLATAWVDLDVIGANVRLLAEAARGAAVMAVVKADAFGHGAIPVARTALESGATWLGVARIEEAVALREAHLAAPVLAWLLEPRLVPAAVARGIDISASSSADLEGIARAAETAGRRARVHLKLDTGLHRAGVPPSAWPAVLRLAARLASGGLVRVVGVWSHLSHGDVVGHPEIERQQARFADGLAVARRFGVRPEVTHLANTGAVLQGGAIGGTMVRVGAGVYGIDVFGGALGACPLRPALTLTTHVVAVREIAAGDGVGYRHDWVADRPTRLALVPLGYADGLPRGAVGSRMLLHGRSVAVVGRISMDQAILDAGDAPVAVGDPVVVFGPGRPEVGWMAGATPSVDDWARWAGTIPHDVLSGIGARVDRRYVRSDP
ncbi:MAG TPA: alanine racemase [Candidatus Limnocylindrales bacterium]